MNRYKTLVSNTLLISAGAFGSKILVFLMVRFYTAHLTPSEYGTADILMQTANLLIPLLSLGIADAVFRFAIDSSIDSRGVYTAGFYITTLGCILLIGAIPLLNMIPFMHNYGWLIAVFTAASCYHSLCAQFVRARGNTALFATQGLINTALVVSLNVLFLAFMDLGITGYILAVAFADILTASFLFIREQLWRQFVSSPSKNLVRQMLHYCVPLIPTSAFWWITNVSDRYIISACLGNDLTGVYSVAYKVPTLIIILSSIFMDAWHFSAVSESDSGPAEHTHFYSAVWSTFQSAMFLCGSVVIAFSQEAIEILASKEFYSAWSYVPVLAMAMVYTAFAGFMGSVYVVTKQSVLSLRTAMLGAAINIGLNLLLIPSPLGVQGAAIATFIAYLTVFIVRAISTRKLIPFRINAVRLTVCTAALIIQSVCIVQQLPGWQAFQAAGIATALLCGFGPLKDGLHKALPATLIYSAFLNKGGHNDSNSN